MFLLSPAFVDTENAQAEAHAKVPMEGGREAAPHISADEARCGTFQH